MLIGWVVSHEIDKPLSHCCFTHQSPSSCSNGSLTTIFIVVLNDDDDVSLTYTCTLYPLFYTNFKNKRLVVNQFNAALVYVDSEIYYIAWFSRKGENQFIENIILKGKKYAKKYLESKMKSKWSQSFWGHVQPPVTSPKRFLPPLPGYLTICLIEKYPSY